MCCVTRKVLRYDFTDFNFVLGPITICEFDGLIISLKKVGNCFIEKILCSYYIIYRGKVLFHIANFFLVIVQSSFFGAVPSYNFVKNGDFNGVSPQ